MSANGYTMDVGECVAAALMTLRTAAKQDHPWETVFALIPAHFSARLGSAVDDAWLSALNRKDEAQ